MGNTQAKIEDPGIKFGSVYGHGGKTRPGYYFAKDKILYHGKEIPKMNGETDFQKLKYGYLKSNKRVFYNGEPVITANPATFSVVTRNNCGSLSKTPEKNTHFTKLNCVLGVDFIGNQKRIFLGEKIIHTE